MSALTKPVTLPAEWFNALRALVEAAGQDRYNVISAPMKALANIGFVSIAPTAEPGAKDLQHVVTLTQRGAQFWSLMMDIQFEATWTVSIADPQVVPAMPAGVPKEWGHFRAAPLGGADL